MNEQVVNGVRIDLGEAITAMNSARHEAERIDTILAPRDRSSANSATHAEISRALQYIQTGLQVAAAEVQVELWRMKGYGDPRDES